MFDDQTIVLSAGGVQNDPWCKAEIVSSDVGWSTEGLPAQQVPETVMNVNWGQNHKEIRGNSIDRVPQNAAIISSFGTHRRVGHVTRATTTWDSKGAR